MPEVLLETGTRVLLNEAFAITDVFGFEKNGPVVRITELLTDGRLRVGNETGISDAVVIRSSLLGKEKLKVGLDIRLDSQQRVAIEVIGSTKRLRLGIHPRRTDSLGSHWRPAGGGARDSRLH